MRLTRDQIASARSFLFVPGHRPDRFDKAAASGADVVIVDLEDAVAVDDKDRARGYVSEWLEQGNASLVRINPFGTPWFDADLDTAMRHGCPIMVPKADSVAALTDLGRRTRGECDVVALVETATGIERANEVCATAGIIRLAFGNADFGAEVGVAPDDHLALTYARSKLVTASAASKLAPPIDGVTIAIEDTAVLNADIEHARCLGFTGKLCIHPNQVPVVAAGFAPSESEREWARAVVEAGESVTRVNGQMIDKPVLERARRILGT
ncbi:citrate lyase subunit beta/citryl-CoA lyase [Tamaricihabitans halophyticus]|uniref:Citrate lyase subunit beta/citryl-CoA lyase n=1 Tax=Tamaricihabitans halophyticus TaxID=1262583 RepID=A0A4R2PU17_9PSEU|nr:CoA ester lyase [Tamaricihabitans halophyticus]TCP39357.1 citrate lyase subunit beta/citryl-CoA lyase [Tamaricihabitans halophyticus]